MIVVTIRKAALARGVRNSHQLADRMGCNSGVAWKMWNGACEPSLTMLDRICDALDCDLDDLVVRKAGRRGSRASNGQGYTDPPKRVARNGLLRGTTGARSSRSK